MNKNGTILMAALVLGFGLVVTEPAQAQSTTAPPAADATSQHHRQMYQLMKDMTQEMNKMTDDMAHGPLPADRQKQMAQRMERMSKMMGGMARFGATPPMKETDWQNRMQEMRAQMDAMMRNAPMAPKAK